MRLSTMLPYYIIENFLQYTPSALREIALEIRNVVASIAPNTTEEVRYRGLVYYHGNLGGPVSAGICGIKLMPEHVRLYFTHGAFIPDPKRLLKGSGKAMRYVRLNKYETVPWDDIKALIEEHANFDPRSLRIF